MDSVKFDKDKPTHERTHKHTSIGGEAELKLVL